MVLEPCSLHVKKPLQQLCPTSNLPWPKGHLDVTVHPCDGKAVTMSKLSLADMLDHWPEKDSDGLWCELFYGVGHNIISMWGRGGTNHRVGDGTCSQCCQHARGLGPMCMHIWPCILWAAIWKFFPLTGSSCTAYRTPTHPNSIWSSPIGNTVHTTLPAVAGCLPAWITFRAVMLRLLCSNSSPYRGYSMALPAAN